MDMNKHINGCNISKIKHMRKKRIFRNKFNDNASQTACLYDPYIFQLEKIPIDIFFNYFNYFKLFSNLSTS